MYVAYKYTCMYIHRTLATHNTASILTRLVALHNYVLRMCAVALSNVGMTAEQQGRLLPHAADVIQPNATFTSPETASSETGNGRGEAKLSADHIAVIQAPRVVTDSPPLTVYKNFHSTLTLVSSAH